ncbi:MAG TPA: hypothetical protein VNA04_09295 [Thermoanaerobaculia bacterium]|nr:hypothetical protein [Thermoanaerobaculia bacterium]
MTGARASSAQGPGTLAIRRMLVMSLSRLGLACETAAGGADALDQIRQTRCPEVHAIVQKPFDVMHLADLVRDCVEGLRNVPTRTGRGGRVTGPPSDESQAAQRRS